MSPAGEAMCDQDAVDATVGEIGAWLAGPFGSTSWMRVSGVAGSGKSRVLEVLREEHPDAFYFDAAGRDSEELIRALMATTDLLRNVLHPDLSDLVHELRSDKTPRIVLVANTQWAGTLSTSREPDRIRAVASQLANVREQAALKIVTEVAAPRPGAKGRDLDVELPGAGLSAVADSIREEVSARPDGPRLLAALHALGHAQLRQVPFDGWALLCRAAGLEVTNRELEAWSAEFSFLDCVEDPSVGTLVGFRLRSQALALRVQPDARPADTEIDRAMVAELSALLRGGHAPWAAQALPGHAAAAGVFHDLLADPHALAHVPQDALLEAFDTAYPDGIANGSHAAALHYLVENVPSEMPHGEWIAWLSHDAFTRGQRDRAAALAEASPKRLPWRTVWSRWRATGDYSVAADVRENSPERGIAVDHHGTRAVLTENETGTRFVWHAETGELLAGPIDPGTDLPNTRPVSADSPMPPRWQVDPYWPAEISATDDDRIRGTLNHWGTRAVGVGDLVVMVANQGLYAVKVDPELLEPGPGTFLRRVMGWYGRINPAPFDPAWRNVTTELLTQVFPSEAVHRLAEKDLPPGLRHEPTRRLLTEVGVPAIDDVRRMWLDPLTVENFKEWPWSSVPDAEQPPGSGPFYYLGDWMGSPLVVDGANGRVLRMLQPTASRHTHPRQPLVGSSLGSFVAMVTLQYRYLEMCLVSTGPDYENALQELQAWLAEADPEAAASDCWQYALEEANWG